MGDISDRAERFVRQVFKTKSTRPADDPKVRTALERIASRRAALVKQRKGF